MLVILKKGMEGEAQRICDKWDVPITQIGEVCDDGFIHIHREGKLVGLLPAESLVLGGGAPRNVRETRRPEYIEEVKKFDINKLANPFSPQDTFFRLLTSPTIASKRWIYEQYDSQVRTNTIDISGDAAVMRIKELPGKGIAVCTDCNSKYTYLDPYKGAMAAVFEAARNVVCVGAEPVGITNCLNFGNPYDPEIYWQFAEAIKGMGDACRALNIPVTGGNVSFHNESQNHAIFPTPTIGMLGIIDDLNSTAQTGFKNTGDIVCLAGGFANELGGSEYLKIIHGEISGKAPDINPETELKLQKALLESIRSSLIESAHDCSEGGLSVSLAEMAIKSRNGLGCEISLDKINDTVLFGESNSRIILAIKPENYSLVEDKFNKAGLAFQTIGKVAENKFSINNSIITEVKTLTEAYEGALPSIMVH